MSYSWEDLRTWVIERNPEVAQLDADTDIIETRIVNSLQFVELMLYVEELCGRELGADEVNLEAFRTLRSIEKSFLVS
ncbi:MAG TPA: acyl carrier protein [Pseudonocardia sp.]|jgi:acyl carrier protein|nr:acyl carrier protein [Pseudonocardia sp.]